MTILEWFTTTVKWTALILLLSILAGIIWATIYITFIRIVDEYYRLTKPKNNGD